jgi:hypothetical protein
VATLQQYFDWYAVESGKGAASLGLKPSMTEEEYNEKYPDSTTYREKPRCECCGNTLNK